MRVPFINKGDSRLPMLDKFCLTSQMLFLEKTRSLSSLLFEWVSLPTWITGDGTLNRRISYSRITSLDFFITSQFQTFEQYLHRNKMIKICFFVLRKTACHKKTMSRVFHWYPSITLYTYSAEYELFQIELSKSYGITEWKDDLKKLLMKAGVDNKPMVFLFVDTQVSETSE